MTWSILVSVVQWLKTTPKLAVFYTVFYDKNQDLFRSVNKPATAVVLPGWPGTIWMFFSNNI